MWHYIVNAMYDFLYTIGTNDNANGIAIIITCGSLLAKVLTIPKGMKGKKGKQINLGSDLIDCDWKPYWCLLFAPFINLGIYFISIIIAYLEHLVVVNSISQNQLLILISLILVCTVSEISFFTVFGVNFKHFINSFGKGIAFLLWNLAIACMLSMIWDYIIITHKGNFELTDVFWYAIPIYIFGVLVAFWKIHFRSFISSNQCIEWNDIIGFVSISIYVVVFLGEASYLADVTGVIWIVSMIAHILLYNFCWYNVKGTVYLKGSVNRDSILVFSILANDGQISYLKSDSVFGQRTKVYVNNFIKMEWKRRVYCPRREIREAIFFNGTENEIIKYTEKKKLGKNFTRLVNRQEDRTAIITVVRTSCIQGDCFGKDERILAFFMNKVRNYILSKNYNL